MTKIRQQGHKKLTKLAKKKSLLANLKKHKNVEENSFTNLREASKKTPVLKRELSPAPEKTRKKRKIEVVFDADMSEVECVEESFPGCEPEPKGSVDRPKKKYKLAPKVSYDSPPKKNEELYPKTGSLETNRNDIEFQKLVREHGSNVPVHSQHRIDFIGRTGWNRNRLNKKLQNERTRNPGSKKIQPKKKGLIESSFFGQKSDNENLGCGPDCKQDQMGVERTLICDHCSVNWHVKCYNFAARFYIVEELSENQTTVKCCPRPPCISTRKLP